jgi:hypothetical protein
LIYLQRCIIFWICSEFGFVLFQPAEMFLLPVIDKAITKDLGEANPTLSRRLVGAVGETQTTVFTDGKILLGISEVWDAVSHKPISADSACALSA